MSTVCTYKSSSS